MKPGLPDPAALVANGAIGVSRSASRFATDISVTTDYLPESITLFLTEFLNWSDDLDWKTIRPCLDGAIDFAIDELERAVGMKLGDHEEPLLLAFRPDVGDQWAARPLGISNIGLPLQGEPRTHFADPIWLRIEREKLRRHALTLLAEYEPSVDIAFRGADTPKLMVKALTASLVRILVASRDFDRGTSAGAHVILQRMRPSMLAPGQIEGDFWTSSQFSFDKPFGQIRLVQHEGRLDYLPLEALKDIHPEPYHRLQTWRESLEATAGTACRVRFGIDGSQLFLLGVYAAPHSGEFSLGIATHLVRTGRTTSLQALMGLPRDPFEPVESQQSISLNQGSSIATGVSLGRSVISGRAAITSSYLLRLRRQGIPSILLRESLKPSDGPLVTVCDGLVGARGGHASHLAALARGLGKAYLVGVRNLAITEAGNSCIIGGREYKEGEWLTIDEPQGLLFRGKLKPRARPHKTQNAVVGWAKDASEALVYVDANTAEEALDGLSAGANGIGLCRTEYHLTESQCLLPLRAMLIGSKHIGRPVSSEPLRDLLAARLTDLLRVAKGMPVLYRLADLSADGVLPEEPNEERQLASELGLTLIELRSRSKIIQDVNPLLGCRAVRLGIMTGLYRLQVEIAVQVVGELAREELPINLIVVVPMISSDGELRHVANLLAEAQEYAPRDQSQICRLSLGCMIETPRAALVARDIAPWVDLLCIGTSDLTQTTWQISRDEASASRRFYLDSYDAHDPFEVLDRQGVGELILRTVASAKEVNPSACILAAGQHASNPDNFEWFAAGGIQGVCCGPSRIPTMTLAAAKYSIKSSGSAAFYVPSPPARLEASAEKFAKLVAYVRKGKEEQAIHLARSWGIAAAGNVGINFPPVWKYFKRDLVARWFGKREYRRFTPTWNSEEVLSYGRELSDRVRGLRFSLFPPDIACGSISGVLPRPMLGEQSEADEHWRAILEDLDHSVPIEVFPLRGSAELCFRAVLEGLRLNVEAGVGEAMLVFEQERGDHTVVHGQVNPLGSTLHRPWKPHDHIEARATDGLLLLLEKYGEEMLMRAWHLADSIGVKWLAIEGYFNPDLESKPEVCDLDLPYDLAFYR